MNNGENNKKKRSGSGRNSLDHIKKLVLVAMFTALAYVTVFLLHFKVGDQFKVLDVDGDAGLIEIIGDNNSPYFVSLKFLSSISDYKID